jgi:hypothetical protein
LKLNGTRQLHFYAEDVTILGESVNTTKQNAEALTLASKGIGLEANADKTKYMVMSRDQTAGRGLNIKIDNSSFERAKESKYLGKTCTYRNSMEDEIKSRLKLEFVIIRRTIFYLPVYYPKIYTLRYCELQFCPFFMGTKNGCST